MAVPIVSWYNSDNTQQVNNWKIGTVDAGSTSNDFTVLIWNNRAGSTGVSNMQDCTITTKDESGADTGDLVISKWIEVRNDSLKSPEVRFTPIGGTTTHSVRTDQSTTNDDGSFTPGVVPHNDSDGSVDILGVKNAGRVDDKGNYLKVTLHANVPSNAKAGAVNFLVRLSYKYV